MRHAKGTETQVENMAPQGRCGQSGSSRVWRPLTDKRSSGASESCCCSPLLSASHPQELCGITGLCRELPLLDSLSTPPSPQGFHVPSILPPSGPSSPPPPAPICPVGPPRPKPPPPRLPPPPNPFPPTPQWGWGAWGAGPLPSQAAAAVVAAVSLSVPRGGDGTWGRPSPGRWRGGGRGSLNP